MFRRPRSRGRSARPSRPFSSGGPIDRALDYKRSRRLRIESLEDRRMLAVNVFIDAVTGNVTIHDATIAFPISDFVAEDNNVTIANGQDTPGRIRITDPGGVILDPAVGSGTQIDATTVEIDPTDVLDIDLQDGNDHLTFDGSFGALDLVTVNVHGGGPANNDRLILNGTTGADESVTISPDNPNHDEQNITGYAGAAFNVRGFEYILYAGEGNNDDLTVDFGFGVVSARVQNAAPGDTDEVLSNTMPPILFRDIDIFTLRGDEGEPTTATFVPDDLQGADDYRFVSLDNADTLIIEGTGGSETITASLNGVNLRIVTGNNTIDTTGMTATDLLRINSLGGDDTFVVNINGTAAISTPIEYDGGDGFDVLRIEGTPSTAIESAIYTPGLQVAEGRMEYRNAAGARLMSIDFDNLEPVIDLVVAANLIVNGNGAANSITYTQAPGDATRGLVSIDGFETIAFNMKANVIVNGLAGNDTFVADNASTPTELQTFQFNGNEGDDSIRLDNVNTTPPANLPSVIVDGGAGNDTIDASLLAASESLRLIGGTGNDILIGSIGNDTLEGGAGDDILIDSLGGDLFDGGSGFDTIIVRGTPGNDTLEVFQLPPTAGAADNYQVRVNNSILVDNITKTIPANAPNDPNNRPTVEEIRMEGLAGNDTFRVTHADQFVDGDNTNGVSEQMLRFTVDGGTPNASDRLIVRDVGTGDLVLVRQAPDSRSGRVTINPVVNVFLGDVVFDNIERLDIQPLDPITGGTGPLDPAMQGRLVVFQPDEFELNDTRLIATDFSDIGTTHRDPNIDPGGDPDFFGPDDGVPGDEDWYEFRPTETSTFRFDVRFTEIATVPSGRPGLPGNGDLDVAVYDNTGALIATGTEVAGFGEQVTFAGEAGASYFLRVKGADLANPFSVAINTYDFSLVEVDVAGPQITDVFITDATGYDLFNPKPTTDGPTPAINSLTIRVQDLPLRAPGFDYPALNEEVAENPGHYRVVGDNYGIIAIESIEVTNDPIVFGQAATATIVITFVDQLPDDRFTITIFDGIVDPAGNQLDGESNNIEPQGDPTVPPGPSGDGIAGGDFVGRFTVDTSAELGTWSAGSVYLDLNGNYTFDPQSGDQVNRDAAATLGLSTDFIFAGNFAVAGAAANGYDKLAAYGTANGRFRWLIDFTGVLGLFTVFTEPAGFNGTGTPVAGEFDGNLANGDEIGLFTGTEWIFDVGTHDFSLANEVRRATAMRGLPVVGDFDADGLDDLATWDATTNTFYFSETDFGGGPSNPIITYSFRIGNGFPFLGTRERPVAGDLDGDGFDELGLFVPDRSGVPAQEIAEWYFFSSRGEVPGVTIRARNTGRVEFGSTVLDFQPKPFGNDIFAQFGDEFALPVVGNFDPPGGASVPEHLPGDYNFDDVVDLADREKWVSTFGSTTDLDADGNSDNQINAADYVIWRDHLGAAQSSASNSAGVAAATMTESSDTTELEMDSPIDLAALAWLDRAFASLGETAKSRRASRASSPSSNSSDDLLLLLAQQSLPTEDAPIESRSFKKREQDEAGSEKSLSSNVQFEFDEIH